MSCFIFVKALITLWSALVAGSIPLSAVILILIRCASTAPAEVRTLLRALGKHIWGVPCWVHPHGGRVLSNGAGLGDPPELGEAGPEVLGPLDGV